MSPSRGRADPAAYAANFSGAFTGLPAAPGIGIGFARLYRHTPAFHEPAEYGEPESEWAAFQDAQQRVDAELERLSRDENSLVAEIFSAHRAILHDPMFTEWVRREIFEEERSAAAATQQATSALADQFQALDDDYFASRSVDILDLGNRLLTHLSGQVGITQLALLPAQSVLIADDLTPSDLTQLAPKQVVAIALAGSTPTAHSAILARAYGIPMICALGLQILQLAPDSPVIVDGSRGLLIARPAVEDEARYQAARVAQIEHGEQATRHAHEPAVMRGGFLVPVLANANSPSDVMQSAASGADGIGLLRTEYLFRGRTTPPSLEEQMQVYGEPPYADMYAYAFVMGYYEALYKPYTLPPAYVAKGTQANLGPWNVLGSEYNFVEKINVFRGFLDVASILYPQLQEIDFRQDVPRLETAIYILDGAAELSARRDLALEWFDLLNAPIKRIYTFENAAHATAFEQFEAFQQIMVETVLPETYSNE